MLLTAFVPFLSLLASAGTGPLYYYGGPVISNVKVVAVFWGPSVNADLVKRIPGFYSSVVNSTYMDWLNEYNTTGLKAVDGRDGTNQTVGRGTYLGGTAITPFNTKTTVTDADVQNELSQQIAAGKLPQNDPNTLYMIHFPPGMTIAGPDGSQSCMAFCGYHEGFKNPSNNVDTFYSILPDLSTGACAFGCGQEADPFDNATSVAAHELIEAVTDAYPTPGDKPAYPQAWNTKTGDESGDLCSQENTQLTTPTATYVVQRIYDNKTQSCASGPYTTGAAPTLAQLVFGK